MIKGHTEAAYERLIERFVAWAKLRDDIRAAVIVGSRARTNTPTDEWSDLDLLLFTTDPQRYVSNTDWLVDLGDFWLSFLDPTADGKGTERRVLFDGGIDADFVPLPLQALESATSGELDEGIRTLLARGVRFILDKNGFEDRFAATVLATPSIGPPPEKEFLNVVNDFWYHCVWAAKKLRRGEFWAARCGLQGAIRWHCLLPMIEWHAKAIHGWDYDTWHRGRFLERWADPHVLVRLRDASARYSAEEVARALFGTMDLFREIARDVAARLNYPYPTDADEKVTQWVTDCLAERTAPSRLD